MGFISDVTDSIGLTGSKQKSKSSSTTETWTPEQKRVSEQVGNWLEPRVGQGATAYGGARVAGMSVPENYAGQWLNNYLQQKTPQQYGWANTGVQKALDQNYGAIVDPSQATGVYNWATGQATGALNDAQSGDIINSAATDRLYGAIKDQVLKHDLPDLQDSIATNANLHGMYFSGAHDKQQSDLVGDVTSRLAETLANLRYSDETQRRDIAREREGRTYSTLADVLRASQDQQDRDIMTGQDIGREREARSFAAIPLAMDIGRQQDQLPVERAAAGYTYGSIPRQNTQDRLDAQYAEFLRTLPENSPFIEQALAYLARQGYQSSQSKSKGSGSGGLLNNIGLNIGL